MHDEVQTVHELLKSAIITRFRICRVDGEEHPDRSWQRVTCRVHRDDVRGGAVPLLYAVSARSFFARSRGTSDIDYIEKDDWSVVDFLPHLHLEPGGLVFDADYIRGRMMKTTMSIASNGRFVIETRNRHEMAVRWLRTLKGKKHNSWNPGTLAQRTKKITADALSTLVRGTLRVHGSEYTSRRSS